MGKRINFDQWRKDYRTQSFKDHQEQYEVIEETYPSQIHFNPAFVIDFLHSVADKLETFKILELGGWKGELAETIRRRYPVLWNHLTSWENYEICISAIKKSVCTDPKYKGIPLNKHIWKYVFFVNEFNIFIGSHVLEHMIGTEARALLSFLASLRVTYLYLDVPIPRGSPVDWSGYNGTHILEFGWEHLEEVLERLGYIEEMRYADYIGVWKYYG